MAMKLAYVSGAYRAKTEYEVLQNIRKAEEVAVWLWQEGWAVICPHKNTAFLGGSVPDEVWIEGDLEILKRCDAIVMLPGWYTSLGAIKEHQRAMELGLDVFHCWPSQTSSWTLIQSKDVIG